MKKVGIITYHFAKNYGAVLQCYALQTYLSQHGYTVEVFNYISNQQRRNNGIIKRGISLKNAVANICLVPFMVLIKKKHEHYSSFCNHYLNLTRAFSEIEELEQYINTNDFDVIISGSDQVLNSNISDFDYAFLYPFNTRAKKIAYAASTGNASIEDIKGIEKFLKDFHNVSIREQNDLYKFDDEIAKNIEVVCDPVMLLKADAWKDMIGNNEGKPYVACYFLHKNLFRKEFMAVKEIARKLGLEIKVINARFGRYSFLKGTVFDAGPQEFVDLIANASYVCTDSFHGTLFSLIFHKRFSCFDIRNNRKDTRKKGLLESVGALQALQNIEDEIRICPELDYRAIDERIEAIRKHSGEYLKI